MTKVLLFSVFFSTIQKNTKQKGGKNARKSK